MARTGKSKVTFRLPNGVVEAVVEGHAHVVRGKIKDSMKRYMKQGRPKTLSFTDLKTNRKFQVQLGDVETWKVTRFYGNG